MGSSAKRARDRYWLSGALVLAAVLRFLHLLDLRRVPLFDLPIMDPAYHHEWAQAIADGQWWGSESFFRAPLYPYLLAFVYRVFGSGPYAPRLFQFMLGIVGVLLVWKLGRRYFDRATALIGAYLAAICWELIYFEGELLLTSLSAFLFLSTLFLLSDSKEAGPRRSLLAGILMGLAGITRPNLLLFAPLAFVWLLFRGKPRGGPGREDWNRAVYFMVFVLLIIAPVTIHNAVVGKEFVLISSQGGLNFFIGNNPQSDGTTAVVPGTRGDWWGGYFDVIQQAEDAVGIELKPSEVSSYYYDKALRFALKEPAEEIRLLLRKAYLFWSGRQISNNQAIYFFAGLSRILRLPLPGFFLLSPLALLGIAISLFRKNRPVLLYFFIVSHFLGVIMFFVCSRYRIPLYPVLFLFAGYAVSQTVRWFKAKNLKSGFASLIAGTILFSVFSIPHVGWREPHLNSMSFFSLGKTMEKKGDVNGALEYYRRALDVDPPNLDAFLYSASALNQAGRWAEARAAYEKAISLGILLAEAHNGLGSIAMRLGEMERARAEFSEALRLKPNLDSAHYNLGRILQLDGRLAEAELEYRRTLEINSSHAGACNNLGTLAEAAGDIRGAEIFYRETIRFDPEYTPAYRNLGRVLLDSNRPAAAMEILREAVERDPGNARGLELLREAGGRILGDGTGTE